MCYIVYVNKCSYYSTANSVKEEEMEDKLLVAKTLLECYPHLDDLYEVLTGSSESCVHSGFYAIFPSEQMSIYERLIRYEERKVGLYNMKYLVEEAFRREKSAPLSLLKEKYINKRSMIQIMEKYGVSLRTCYRYLKRGLSDFCRGLENAGFSKQRLLLNFGNEPLFQTMLSKVIREDDMERLEQERAEEKKKERVASCLACEKEKEGERKGGTPGGVINNRRTPLPHGGSGHGCYVV